MRRQLPAKRVSRHSYGGTPAQHSFIFTFSLTPPPRRSGAVLWPMLLPSQNQLYGHYVARCGHHAVRKPHRAVLDLLAEDTASQSERLAAEAAERGVDAADLAQMEDSCEGAATASDRAAVVPLARRRVFRLTDCGAKAALSPIYVGARGLLPVLDLIAELPLLETLDLSNIASWYDNDTFAGTAQGSSVSGNEVVEYLCGVLPRLRFLRTLDLGAQPLGSIAVAHLLAAVEPMTSIVDVRLDTSCVDPFLVRSLEQALGAHRELAPPVVPPLRVFSKNYTLPAYIQSLPPLDRKTLREQQVLRALLCDDANFTDALTEAEMSTVVLTARVMSTTEALFRCGDRGIRGDEQHLFLLKSGTVRVFADLEGFTLARGDYFGDSYSAVLLPCTRLVEEERGVVYAIPLSACAALLARWEVRLNVATPWISRTPLLQPVGAWTRMRVGTCSELATYTVAETLVEAGDAAEKLFLVCEGTFAALESRGKDSGRYSARGARAVFGPLDVFGVEALVARKRQSSVCIKAGRDREMSYRALEVRGCAVRALQRQLRPVFAALSRSYSLHEDLGVDASAVAHA